jgi:NADPH:quinone reductase-like Zn-dependent oxidoreductase
MTSRAFWVAAPGRGAIREVDVPSAGPNEVSVRMLFSGISRGTETLVFSGQVPTNQHDVMRCPHQDGQFSFPIKYGYIGVGRVESEGPLAGRPVFCLHPHQTHFVVSIDDVIPLPVGLEPGLAVLAANLETAVNGVWDAQIESEDTVTVIGAGVVGLLVAWRIRQEYGHVVEVLDTNKSRSGVVEKLGLQYAHPTDATPERTVIIHASGSESGLRQALSLAASEGRIIEMSWFGSKVVSLPLGENFHSKRLTIRSSQVGAIPPEKQDQWTYRSRMEMVLQLLSNHPELEILINEESAFADLPKTMAQMVNGGGDVLCHRVFYEEK